MVVFSAILEIKIDGLGIESPRRPPVGVQLFLITGLVPFLALNDAALRASRVFRTHSSLVQRLRMPAEVLVVGDVLGAVIHHAISFVVVLAIYVVGGHAGILNLPWLIGAFALFALWIIGLGLVASVLGAVLPDTRGPWPRDAGGVLGAPIVYPLSLVPEESSSRLCRPIP